MKTLREAYERGRAQINKCGILLADLLSQVRSSHSENAYKETLAKWEEYTEKFKDLSDTIIDGTLADREIEVAEDGSIAEDWQAIWKRRDEEVTTAYQNLLKDVLAVKDTMTPLLAITEQARKKNAERQAAIENNQANDQGEHQHVTISPGRGITPMSTNANPRANQYHPIDPATRPQTLTRSFQPNEVAIWLEDLRDFFIVNDLQYQPLIKQRAQVRKVIELSLLSDF